MGTFLFVFVFFPCLLSLDVLVAVLLLVFS